MSNKPETFAPYFKIRWSRKSCWNLIECSYLSIGLDPDFDTYEISPQANNVVSKRYYWLKNKAVKNIIRVVDNVNGVDYFGPGALWRLLSEKFPVDKEFEKIFNHMYSSENGIPAPTIVNKAVYREAGRIVYELRPFATKATVAEFLTKLPDFYNTGGFGKISTFTPAQIQEWLKELGQISGNIPSEKKQTVDLDLKQLLELMD